ncbi:MAG TPA: N-acetyl-alpha-D-glucosaminyl L-malate synthase BshA [Gemmatimonadales bacterium]
MRIGITCYPTYGGSGALATELGLALSRRGHEVHVISYASPFRLRHYAEHLYFHEVDLSGAYPLLEYFPYSLALAVKQHEIALEEHLEILHVHYAVPHATAAFLAKEMLREDHDLRVVTTLHGTDITLVGQEKSFFQVTKFSIEQSDAVTAVSRYLRDETYEKFGCDGCCIDVIPNFVNLDEYHPLAEGTCRSSLAPPGSKVLMHISNFRAVKRVSDVVRIFARMREQLDCKLVLVGDGPERPEVIAEADRLGVRDQVTLLGKMDTVADLLQCADLFLLPSVTESFGLAALEAMACGVPVIASNVGGLPEVVVEGSGFLLEMGDLDGMARAGIDLLQSPQRHREASEAAVRVAQRFSADLIVPQYEAIYRRVLGEP